MKCRDCGTTQGNRHKQTCPVWRYNRPPFYVGDSTYAAHYENSSGSDCSGSSGGSSSSSDSSSSSGSCD